MPTIGFKWAFAGPHVTCISNLSLILPVLEVSLLHDVTWPQYCVQVLAILEEYYVNGDIQDAATTLQASFDYTCGSATLSV